jgi:hypothetical protein
MRVQRKRKRGCTLQPLSEFLLSQSRDLCSRIAQGLSLLPGTDTHYTRRFVPRIRAGSRAHKSYWRGISDLAAKSTPCVAAR